ncbi:hypothetical protein BVRB_6g148010 [Beta vulgaris subsp. vulgaris]|nr:hypothetical protein BVRB_6g148010 [Beta vulgaris subsp. vulgaris]
MNFKFSSIALRSATVLAPQAGVCSFVTPLFFVASFVMRLRSLCSSASVIFYSKIFCALYLLYVTLLFLSPALKSRPPGEIPLSLVGCLETPKPSFIFAHPNLKESRETKTQAPRTLSLACAPISSTLPKLAGACFFAVA